MISRRKLLQTVRREIDAYQNQNHMMVGMLHETTTTMRLARVSRFGKCRSFNSRPPPPSSSILKLRRHNRPRKPKQLARTKRNRIRNFEKPSPDTSLFSSFKLPDIDPEKAGDTVESSLLAVRNGVYNFWKSGGASLIPQQQGHTQHDLPQRPRRLGPNMDARWWFWNIGFALMPAICLSLYFEFILKDEAEEFYRNMEEKQRMKEGLDTDDGDLDEGNYDGEDGDDTTSNALQTSKGLSERLDDVYQIVAHVLFPNNAGEEQPPSEEQQKIYKQQSLPPIAAEEDHVKKSLIMQKQVDRINSQQQQQGKSEIAAREQNQQDASESEDEKDGQDDPAVLEMRRRIDELERIVTEQLKKDREKTRQKERRINQSNVRNRIERRELEFQQQEESKMDDPSSTHDETTMTDQVKEALWQGMKENVSAKKEDLQKFGSYMMSKVLGEKDSSTSDNGVAVKVQKEDNSIASKSHQQGTKSSLSSTKENEQNKKNSQATDLVASVETAATATTRVAPSVSTSLSESDPKAAADAALKASQEATKAAEAAQKAASFLSSPSPSSTTTSGHGEDQQQSSEQRGLVKRSWRSLFQRKSASPQVSPHASNIEESNSKEN